MKTKPRMRIDTSQRYDQCFGCGPKNPIGLKLSFKQDGKTARAEFIPTEFYQSWGGIVHGGIITTILDEAMFYAAFFEGVSCVTASIEAKFRHPILIGEPLTITGFVTGKRGKLVETEAAISSMDGTLLAEGKAKQIILNTAPSSESEEGET